ncbi:MAG TPA: LytTR family DNA-binding domain-containing protein [Gemmatimonadaceae bacterium]|nr:LytTR family DNA-binding domain-containing protein [Gemmatimonadaceae bacterium]
MTGPPADVIRVLVVDDEPDAREGIAAMVAAREGFAVVGTCGDGAAAARAVGELAPDLVLLDVQMPAMGGFDVIRAVGPARMPAVVFVTAHDEHALRAFEAHALDYVLKPFSDRRLAEALERGRAAVRSARLGELAGRLLALVGGAAPAPAPNEPAAPLRADRFVVPGAGPRRAVVVVRAEEVDWVEGASYYARLHAAGRSYLLRETLASLERRLDPRRVVRVHRSAIVNVDRVRELRRSDGGEPVLMLSDRTLVRVSRSRWPAVSGVLERWRLGR